MKLLGWMHRKFRQSGNEPFKDFSIGNSCACLTGQPSLDELHLPHMPSYCSKPLVKGYRENNYHHRKSLGSPDQAARTDEDDPEDETSAATHSDIFHGFLAIGTLGMDPSNADPSMTPTFSISVENIMEKETQVTEDELKVINDELEKVLGADESCNVSSGRNSHVSTGRNSHVSAGRSSHCSTITLSGKPRESTENNDSSAIVCPLQSYLLGSAMGYHEATSFSAAKRQHRESLGELFEKTKLTQVEENFASKPDNAADKKMEKEREKSAAFLLKKLLKRKALHAPTRSTNESSGGTTDPVSSETKLNKILQIFHRKVHPESSLATKKSIKTRIGLMGKMGAGGKAGRPAGPERSGPVEDITIIPRRASSSEKIRCHKGQSNPAQMALNGSSTIGIGLGEHWIKSDSDCTYTSANRNTPHSDPTVRLWG